MTKIFARFSVFTAAALALLPVSALAENLLIVQLGPASVPTAVAKKYGITLKDTTSGAPFALFSAPSAAKIDAVQASMLLDPGIVWSEDEVTIGCPESQSKTVAKKGGGLPAVGDRKKLQDVNKNLLAQVDWSSTLANGAGRTVRLAILDTGLAEKQTALWAKVDASANFIEAGKPAYDKPMKKDTNGNGTKDDAVGHGTMVAGIVDQVAPQVRLVIARVADSDGMASGWSLIKGLAFAVTSKAEVANVSLGTQAQVAAVSDVMDWCEQNRLLVVAAAGNDGIRSSCYPARISKISCVTGLEADNRKASFANWESAVDMAAPAVGIASQFWDGELAVWSGTSFASPIVAAGVADCLRRVGASSPNALRKALTNSGAKIDNVNSKYKGQIGVLIDIVRLNQALMKP